MGFFDALSRGLERSREALNEVFYFGGEVDEDFWEDLEDTLVMGDMGAEVAIKVSDDLRDAAAKKNLKTAPQLRRALAEQLEQHFVPIERDPFSDTPSCVLFVGINGAGKTTTVGKIASAMAARGKNVVIGSADTFRAAAIEQLDVWGQRAGVPVIKRDRGSDPASVCYDVLDEADKRGSDLVLIDTAGRLHTSPELMRELAKVVNVTRKRAANMAAGPMPVSVVLVIDAATGQNGLNQALEFNEALGLDGLAAIPWTSTQYAFWSMLIAFCFCSIGGNLLVYMAAMKKIPDDLFEAAFMDGATEGKIFFRITLPLIADNVKTQFTFWTIGCIGFFLWSRVFSVVPSDPTTITPASYMYDQIFGTSISSNAVASGTNVGMGAAIGVVLCLITVAAMALINLIFPKEKYEM